MPLIKYKSYAVTLRPLDGIQDVDMTMFMKIVYQIAKYYHVITEKEDGAKHIHACLYLRKPESSSAFNQRFMRKFKDPLEARESIWKHAYKAKNMYNDDFYAKYLVEENEEGAKADDPFDVVDTAMCDVKERCTYYQDTQQRERKEKRSADPYYSRLLKMYMEKVPKDKVGFVPDPSLEQVHQFLYEEMMELKIRVISDGRKYRRVCKMLQALICWRCKKCIKDYPFERGTIQGEIDEWPKM